MTIANAKNSRMMNRETLHPFDFNPGCVEEAPMVAIRGLRERVLEDVHRTHRFGCHSATRGCTGHPPRNDERFGGQEDQVEQRSPKDQRQFTSLEVRKQ